MLLRKIFRKYPLCGRASTLFFYLYNPFAAFKNFLFPKKKTDIPKNPAILLCCRASLGDVFLACFVIPTIKQNFPTSRIGFLCTPQTSCVLKTQKEIDEIFELDRWDFLAYRKVAASIRKKKYQVSLELHPFFPNSLPITKKAKIPCRIGFDSGGFDFCATDPVFFPRKLNYLPKLYSLLLEKLQIPFSQLKPEVTLPLNFKKQLPENYLVLHAGTSFPLKEWDPLKWRELATTLQQEGHHLIFTGRGVREKELIEKAFKGLGQSLCDQLEFHELVFVLKNAKGVISVDSVPVHLAAFYKVPLIALYLYNQFLEMWIPDTKNGCFLIGKNCVRRNQEEIPPQTIYLDEIEVLDVLQQVRKLL